MELVLSQAQFSYGPAEKPQLSLEHFSLLSNDHWALVGPNGSGKSTLLGLLSARLHPQKGSLMLDGQQVGHALSYPQFYSQVALASQDPESSLVASEVSREVAFGPRNLGLPPQEVQQRVQVALEAVGLSSLAHQTTHSLSGGQLQRLQLAGLLPLEPSFLLLDEITSSLNAQAARAIGRLLKSGHPKECGQLLSTHEVQEIVQAQQVAVMHRGHLHAVVSPQRLFEDESLWRLMGYHERFLGQMARALALAHKPVAALPNPDVCVEAWQEAGFLQPALKPQRDLPQTQGKKDGLEFCQVTLTSPHSTLVDEVSFLAPAGRITLLLGASGSGKTCLSRMGAGLLPADKGQVLLQGSPVRPGQVAYGAQRSEDMLFCNTVAEDVAFGPTLAGLSGKALDRRVEESLDALGLDFSLARRSSFELSGGQRRKAALAAVLAQQAPALICDEPCANLDPAGIRQVVEAVAAQARQGAAVLVTTHDPEPWLQVASQVVILEAGTVFWQGTPWQLVTQAPLAACSAGEPLALTLRRHLIDHARESSLAQGLPQEGDQQ